MSQTIEIQNDLEGQFWNPFIGDETQGLLRSNSNLVEAGQLNEAGQRVLDETYRIMQACGNPILPAYKETGLIIGYVQSGKTLSFTTLTALARDNNYQLVIVIGGTTTNLLNQSTARLRKDLRVDNRYGFEQKWNQITNPESNEDFETISNVLRQWSDPTFPKDRCKTILITVMKQGQRLQKLANLFQGIDLTGVPTLIIDDEGDQASLNTRAGWAARQGIQIENLTENDVSMIYRRINSLRNVFPHHTFLQYTATPQANLFINIMDRLSPNFIKLLTPGDDYTGGSAFFNDNSSLVIEIPQSDLPLAHPLHEPPDSLLRSLRLFYLGVVAGIVSRSYRQPGQRNRSMLIHPSRLQGDHTTFYRWINNIKGSWRRLLAEEPNDERDALIADFQIAYNDLEMTVSDLPSFAHLTDVDLIHAIQYTPIVEVNSREGSTPQINWQDSYSWILVGGQSMDRGFTVEGLTVTYMPRNIGVGNVDTIQQRARFFGYKRNYLGYCRVFLDQVTIDSYNSIIEHEEDVREQLGEYNINNRHLNNWDRKAVLDGMLNLTRANILYDDLDRDRFGNEWFRINAPHDTEQFITTNRETIFSFIRPKAESFVVDEGHSARTEDQKHLVASIPAQECLDNLLNNLRFTKESDSAAYSSLRGILKRFLRENLNEPCRVYLMSANSLDDWKRRLRRLNANDEIQQLFQGRNPKTGDVIYPGDAEIKNDNVLVIQIHMLDLRDTDFTNVPTIAIWVPERIGKDIVRLA